MTPYYQIDHAHCFDQSGAPPCGKSAHTKCCLCGVPNPAGLTILNHPDATGTVAERLNRMNP